MKKIMEILGVALTALMLSSAALADDPKVTDRKEKPVCHTQCDTCSRCIKSNSSSALDDCDRYEYYQCNCREICN